MFMHDTCRYNVQCPNENFNLYYTMIEFSVEPPVSDTNSSKCLDFMRMFTESNYFAVTS